MWPILIVLLLIIGVLFALSYFRGREKPKSDILPKGGADFPGERSGKELRVESGQVFPPPVPDRLPSAPGVLNPDLAVPDQAEELKKRLRAGVTLIFSIKSSLNYSGVEGHHTPGHVELERLGLSSDELKYLLVLFLSDQVAKLFAEKGPNDLSIASLDLSCRSLFPKKKLLYLILDSSLFSEIKKARTIMGRS